MFINQLIINFLLFISATFGILFNRRSIIIVLMCIELILLSVNLNFLILSIYLDDAAGLVFSLLILTVAAAESAIGLAIIILYYRIRGNILINDIAVLKG
jgi:NADH-quinone oxidoreductase subunit K|uniref:NADH dehydrogenase subunit 4L n=1 Tax=Ochromonas danica TaxID=2986 RepID=Q37570_OCHDN|nr:NADH dehydrogenase subunit 4L [Ochromonas danica]AAB00439.1 NADH dehydrogenase subunit 4L [Ochromonas danica]AAG18414.1 NADH dehydrogenase subunit 4L [Ochromonas danica]